MFSSKKRTYNCAMKYNFPKSLNILWEIIPIEAITSFQVLLISWLTRYDTLPRSSVYRARDVIHFRVFQYYIQRFYFVVCILWTWIMYWRSWWEWQGRAGVQWWHGFLLYLKCKNRYMLYFSHCIQRPLVSFTDITNSSRCLMMPTHILSYHFPVHVSIHQCSCLSVG